MIKRSYFHVFSLLAVAVFAVFALGQPANAADLGAGSSSASWSQTVQLTTASVNAVISMEVTSPLLAGTGTAVDPYITHNQNVTLDIKLIGAGRMVLTDREGQVVATYDKQTAPEEIIQVGVTLSELGDYNFTATYYDLNDLSHIYNLVKIYVRFESVSLYQPFPLPPNTGVIYLKGYALPILALAFWLFLAVGLVGGVFFLVKHRLTRKK
jgi:hypothetical protein